jgi:hypothetical protein
MNELVETFEEIDGILYRILRNPAGEIVVKAAAQE